MYTQYTYYVYTKPNTIFIIMFTLPKSLFQTLTAGLFRFVPTCACAIGIIAEMILK